MEYKDTSLNKVSIEVFFFCSRSVASLPFGHSEQSTEIFAVESNFILPRRCTIWSNKLFLIANFFLWYFNLVIWKIENRIANKINTWFEFDSYFCCYCSWHVYNYVLMHLLRLYHSLSSILLRHWPVSLTKCSVSCLK